MDIGRAWYNNAQTVFSVYKIIDSANSNSRGQMLKIYTAAYINRDIAAQKAKETEARPSPSPIPPISDLEPVQL
jgi:hypothetical protein